MIEKSGGREGEERRRREKMPYQNPRTTERQLRESKAEVIIDGLTGVLNRRGFEVQMRAVYEDKGKKPAFAIIMLDADKFKEVNDTLGHGVGDVVLRTLAIYLQSHIRATDVICRQGGEEFLIALKVTEVDQEKIIEEVMRAAEKLRKGIEELDIHLPTQDIKVTVSMGVADGSSAERFEDIKQFIDAADAALYVAKNNGRNRVVSAPSPLPDEKRIAT